MRCAAALRGSVWCGITESTCEPLVAPMKGPPQYGGLFFCVLAKYRIRRHESQAAKTITPTEPLTPGQQRVASLQSHAKRATKAVKAELFQTAAECMPAASYGVESNSGGLVSVVWKDVWYVW